MPEQSVLDPLVVDDVQAVADRETARSVLLDADDDREIEPGDVVRYVELTKPDDVLTVQIASGREDLARGILHESRPLSQALLGAVVGDEVSLHLAGTASRTFRVLEIRRSGH